MFIGKDFWEKSANVEEDWKGDLTKPRPYRLRASQQGGDRLRLKIENTKKWGRAGGVILVRFAGVTASAHVLSICSCPGPHFSLCTEFFHLCFEGTIGLPFFAISWGRVVLAGHDFHPRIRGPPRRERWKFTSCVKLASPSFVWLSCFKKIH